jgi:hypothetical protein
MMGRAIGGSIDWSACEQDVLAGLPEAARHHGLEALLWRRLADVPAASGVRDALMPAVRLAVTRELFVQRDLQRVTEALAGGGVAALIIKGSALAYTVYDEPWLRPRVDTDVIVRPGDVTAATRVLERCGYRRSDATNTGALVSHQVAFERIDSHDVRHVIDLHWKIANPQIVADALPFDDLWHSAAPAPALGPAARVPHPVGAIAISCVHRLAHHQGNHRLIWLYDLKLLAASLSAGDWATLRELACTKRIASLCVDGLRAARDHVGAVLPPEIDSALDAASHTEPARTYLDGQMTKSAVLLSDLRVLETWSDRLRLVREHVFPPAAFIRERYGMNARVMLPALYLHRLIAGASRWVRS